MIHKVLCALIFIVSVSLQPVFAREMPCGPGNACTISGPDAGSYYLAFPDNWNGRDALTPFVFFHGHRGSGAGEIRNKQLIEPLTRQGYLVIAPDGAMTDFRGSLVRSWAARPEGNTPRGKRNDITFVENVLADVARRFPVKRDGTIVSGFSSGGSMAWYFSCYSKTPIAGVVPVAGGLRRPLPEGGVMQLDGSVAKTCPGGPRKIIHIHGYSDRQVPLEGRGIRAWHQGDVFEGLSVQRHTNQCGSRPDIVEAKGPFWCRTWTACKSGNSIRFCLHSGGHIMPKGWQEQSLGWLGQGSGWLATR